MYKITILTEDAFDKVVILDLLEEAEEEGEIVHAFSVTVEEVDDNA